MPPQNSNQQGNGQYDFILNVPDKKPTTPILDPNGSPLKKGLIIVGFLGGVLLLIIVILSLALGGGSSNNQKLINIIAEQQEIARIAELATKDATDGNTRASAATVLSTVSSSQAQLTAVVSKKTKIEQKMISTKKDSSTDKTLESAKKNNRYDEEYLQILATQLSSYQQNMKSVYDDSSKDAQKVLQSSSASALVIQKSITTSSSSANASDE